MRKGVIIAIALGMSMLPMGRLGRSQEKVKTFMRVKLDHSQRVLEGLATENYDEIANNAERLTLLSQEVDWNVIQTAEYTRLSAEFRRATQDLAKAAKAKNLDGATLAYVTVTLNCVQCHKHVRDVRAGK